MRFASFIVLLFSFCIQNSFAQSSIQAGKVTEQVVTATHPDQSYALFLPSNYTADKAWPTIICLDPRARGKTAIERFVDAAEKYGYIVVCSNNSRNGLNGPTVSDIFTTLWDDVHSRFHIDEKRTFAAGMSGGSRLAATFASRCRGCLAGVIGSAAGFPADIQPDAKIPFAYFGIVGVDDFNFGEMWQLEKKLSKLPAPYEFETFAGGHEWPPKENFEHALAWLNLQSIRAGTLENNKSFVEEQFKIRLNLAEELLANHQYVDASRSFAAIVRDFQGLVDVKVAAEKSEQLSKSAEVKKESSVEEDLYRRQLREAGEIRMLWMKAPEPDSSLTSRSQASARLAELRKTREQPTDTKDRRLARRILSHLTIESYETAQASLRNNDYTTALANYELVKEIDPKSPNVLYEIARIHALRREKKPALQFLEEAVTLGFKDLARLKTDAAFSPFKEDPRFLKLLSGLSPQ
jgi:hypothetical protein